MHCVLIVTSCRKDVLLKTPRQNRGDERSGVKGERQCGEDEVFFRVLVLWLGDDGVDGKALKKTGLTIVAYENRYKEAVISLVLGIQNGEAKIGLSLEEQPDLQDIGGYFLSGGGGFWVAPGRDGSVIGCIGLQKRENACGILKKFFVALPFRGREYGVATGLFEALTDHARQCGIRSLVLDSPSVAKRSHAFYRRAGFVAVSKDVLPVAYDFPDRDSLLFMKEMGYG